MTIIAFVIGFCIGAVVGVLFARKNPKDAQAVADAANKAKAEVDKVTKK